MKKVLVLGVLAAVMLAVPTVSSAAPQQTQYYWTPKAAAQALVDGGINWTNGYQSINYAACQGYGGHLTRGGAHYYATFACYVRPSNDNPYYLQLTVAGRTSYRVRFLRYA